MKIKVKQNFGADENKPAAPAVTPATPAPAPDKIDVLTEKVDRLTELFSKLKKFCDEGKPAESTKPAQPAPAAPHTEDLKNFEGPLNVSVNEDGVKEDIDKISEEIDNVSKDAEENATKEVYAHFGKLTSGVRKLVKNTTYKNFSDVRGICDQLSESVQKNFSNAGKVLEAVQNFTDTIDDIMKNPELGPAVKDPEPAPPSVAATDPAKVENKTPVTFSNDVCPVCGEKECKCKPKDPEAPAPAPAAETSKEPKIDPVEFTQLEEANAALEDELKTKDPVIQKFGQGLLSVTGKAYDKDDAVNKTNLIRSFSDVALNAEVVSEVSQEEDPELADKNDRIIKAESSLGDVAIVEFSKKLREFSMNPTKENRNQVMATFADVMEEAAKSASEEAKPADPAPADPAPTPAPAPAAEPPKEEPKKDEAPKVENKSEKPTESKPEEKKPAEAPKAEPAPADPAPAPAEPAKVDPPKEEPKKAESDDPNDVVIPKTEVANFSISGNKSDDGYDNWLKSAYARWF